MNILDWIPMPTMIKSALSQYARASQRSGFIVNRSAQKVVRPEVSDEMLIKHYRSWAHVCATKNATFVARLTAMPVSTSARGPARSPSQPARNWPAA